MLIEDLGLMDVFALKVTSIKIRLCYSRYDQFIVLIILKCLFFI